MKRILLASTASVAFAGAAAADISLSGAAKLGYNDTINTAAGETASGFYTDLDVTVSMSQELDNGLTAAASIKLSDLDDNNSGNGVASSDFVVSLTGDNAGLYYGDTALAADNVWSSTGSMDADTFRTEDGEDVLRGEFTFGDTNVQVSMGDDAGDDSFTSLGVKSTLGSVDLVLAWQEANTATLDNDDNGAATQNEVLGLGVSTTLGGATVGFGYASNDAGNSTGLSVSYPVGDVTVKASYVSESAGDDNWDLGVSYAANGLTLDVTTDESDDWGIEGSYDMGNGLTVFAGVDDAGDDTYVATSYDLGGGASVLFSYADDSDDDNDDDEIGAGDYKAGMTLEVSFAF